MSSNFQQVPSLIWPIDPAKAFQLIVCAKVPYGGSEIVPNSTEKAREPPQPKNAKKKDQQKTEGEEEKNKTDDVEQENELEEEMPLDQRIQQSMARFRLAAPSSEQQQKFGFVEIGEQVELHLELDAVISRFENSSNVNEPLPQEASELHRRLKLGPIRWEAEIPSSSSSSPQSKRFVPAPPCSRCFPFRDTHFNPTADHLGMKMRALAILQDSETDQMVLFKNVNGTTRPSVICSDYFQVIPSKQMRQIMEMAENLGQFGFFAREKIVVDNEENSKNLVPTTKNQQAGKEEHDEEEKRIEENDEIKKAAQVFLKNKTVEGKSLLIACKRFSSDNSSYVGIRMRYREQQNEEGEKDPSSLIHQGKWYPPKNENDDDPISICSLSVADDVSMTIYFSGDEVKQMEVVFNSRLDRDVAATGIRSLM